MATQQQRLTGWRIGDVDLLDLAKDTTRASFEDDVTGIAAQMAYFVVAAVGVLYWRGPNRRVGFAWATPGAALFLAGWVAFSAGFAYYLSKFASYSHLRRHRGRDHPARLPLLDELARPRRRRAQRRARAPAPRAPWRSRAGVATTLAAEATQARTRNTFAAMGLQCCEIVMIL